MLLCTDGGKGSADPALATRRTGRASERRRPRDAGAVLGVAGQEFLELPRRRAGRRSESCVRRWSPRCAGSGPTSSSAPIPTAVFFGQEYFNHRDHRVTGWAALDAVSPAAALPHYFPEAGPAHQVSDGAAVGDPGARCVGGHLGHRRSQGGGGRLPPEPVPRRRRVGVDGGEARCRGRRPAGRGCLRRGLPEAASRWVTSRAPDRVPTGARRSPPRLPGPERVILHVDMDAFFASVEVLDDPSLAGLPVIVGGAGARGVVAACTYEARMFGVHSAMPSSVARRLCPTAVFVDGRFHRYVEESQQAARHLPIGHPAGRGDLARRGVPRRDRIEAAARRRPDHRPRHPPAGVRASCGLTCSVGVGRIKLMAKLASKAAKPVADRDGIAPGPGWWWSPPGEELAFLHPLAGAGAVGGGSGHRAPAGRARGSRPWGTWPAFRPGPLERYLGAAPGAHLAALARGRGPAAGGARAGGQVDRARGDVRLRPLGPCGELHGHLLRMVDASATSLRRSGLAARTVTIKIRFADFTQITRSHSLTCSDRRLPGHRRGGRRRCWTRSSWTRGCACSGSACPGSATAAERAPAEPRSRPTGGPPSRPRRAGPRSADPGRTRRSAGRADEEAERIQRVVGTVTAAVDAIRARYGGSSVGPASLVGPTGSGSGAGGRPSGDRSGDRAAPRDG